jgi:dynein heavy chain
MRPQEWEKIRDLLKSDPEISFEKFSYEDDTFTLNSIRKMNIFKKAEEIQDIAIRAAKEKNLLKMLVDVEDFMKSEKSSINTDTYKDTKDVFILGNNDELIKLLDDKIVTITNILSSRYVHGIKDKVVEQKQILDYYQEFLDELGLCQRMWLYLEPIFNGEDSNRELMKERKTFKKEVHTIFTK